MCVRFLFRRERRSRLARLVCHLGRRYLRIRSSKQPPKPAGKTNLATPVFLLARHTVLLPVRLTVRSLHSAYKLLSDECAWITGENIEASGGLTSNGTDRIHRLRRLRREPSVWLASGARTLMTSNPVPPPARRAVLGRERGSATRAKCRFSRKAALAGRPAGMSLAAESPSGSGPLITLWDGGPLCEVKCRLLPRTTRGGATRSVARMGSRRASLRGFGWRWRDRLGSIPMW